MNGREVRDFKGGLICKVDGQKRTVEINSNGYWTIVQFLDDGHCRAITMEDGFKELSEPIKDGLDSVVM